MARAARDSRLETRTARHKLAKAKRHQLTMRSGLALCYRRTDSGFGVWFARITAANGQERLIKLGAADDHDEADGINVLNFTQAQDKCREFASAKPAPPTTVTHASDKYLSWYRDHRKAYKETEATINAHILPTFDNRQIATLTSKEIRDWLNQLATQPARKRVRAGAKPAHREAPATDEQKRARKSTANRILTLLKAILNKAFHDELVTDDVVWRRVKPFPSVDEPVTRFLTEAESTRLINASTKDLRPIVKAGLFTGARYGELARLIVGDVNLDTGMIYITPEAKSGKGRFVPLSIQGLDFFTSLTVGRARDERVFARTDGRAWGKNHHVRPLQAACEATKIEPPVGFHELRHTYASTLAQLGVDLLSISKLLGHADTRITSRHYAHLCDQTLRDAVKKLPSFGHKKESKIRAIR